MRKVLAALRAHPQMAAAILAAAVVVGLTRAAGPLFATAARDAATEDALAALGPLDRGIEVALFGFAAPEAFEFADQVVTEEVRGRVRSLGESDTGLISRPLEVVAGLCTQPPGGDNNGEDTEETSGCDGPTARARLMHRTEAFANIQLLEGDTSGAVLPAPLAGQLALGPGDQITVRANRRVQTVEVSGLYAPIGDPVPEYWQVLQFHFIPVQPPPLGVQPPPVIMLPRHLHLEVTHEVNEPTQIYWWFPLLHSDLDYRDALTITSRFEAIDRAARDDETALGAALAPMVMFNQRAVAHSGLISSIQAVRDASVELSASTDLLTVAAQVLALLVVAIAGVFTVRARRTEARRAWAQGDSPLRFGLRLTTEAAVPVLVGAALGGLAAWAMIDVAGPGDGLVTDIIPGAVVAAVLSGVVALLLLWIVATVTSAGEFRTGEAGAVRRALARVPWELLPVLLAGFLLYELLTRGTAVVETETGGAQVDPLLVAFPFLALVAVAAVGARLVGGALGLIGNRGAQLPTTPFLALRRLAAAGGLALALTGTVAAAIGLAVYAVTVRASLETTLGQKAAVSVGAPTTVRVPDIGVDTLTSLPFQATAVLRTEAETVPDADTVLLLGVYPETFTDVALLPGALQRAGSLVPQLSWNGEGPVPALLGPNTDTDELALTHYGLELDVIGRVEAFSRQDDELGLVVIDARAMIAGASQASVPTRIQHVTEVWTPAPPETAEEALAAAEVLPLETHTAASFESRPALRGLTQTFVLLEALGVLAVVLAITGLGLYLRARQDETEVSYVLARRMGLRPATHGAAIGLEVSGLLVLATAIGLGAGIGLAWLLHARLDPLPNLAPGAILVVPWTLIVAGIGVLVVTIVVATVLVQRSADRVDPSTVLRHAE